MHPENFQNFIIIGREHSQDKTRQNVFVFIASIHILFTLRPTSSLPSCFHLTAAHGHWQQVKQQSPNTDTDTDTDTVSQTVSQLIIVLYTALWIVIQEHRNHVELNKAYKISGFNIILNFHIVP
ncbi:unnamed protein product [Ambrosiozyma monospora]|uniref:Unnamed protein product n=1 Tax=Ambrosiozyma monospora TaxID=43982 RepID=A0A9W7DEK2_AMBMO|nr:unnamed protein product [Ambrosiozyma monospora]